MNNLEMLELIRKDRPLQKIHEVKTFRQKRFSNEYDVDVIMEVLMDDFDGSFTVIRRADMTLPYPCETCKNNELMII